MLNHKRIITATIISLALGMWLFAACAPNSASSREPKAITASHTPNASLGATIRPTKIPPASTATRVIQITPVSAAALSPAAKLNIPKLQDRLTLILLAYRADDKTGLAALSGDRNIDLDANTVRVILEMDIDPEAHVAGAPRVETVTLADGRTVEIQREPPIAIRADLAQAIAATGAVYETAYQNQVQVLAPFASLEALTKIPGARFVRLPYAAQP